MHDQIQRSKHWQPFFNLNKLAAYHFDLQLVTLYCIDENIIGDLKKNDPQARYKTLPLAAHEYTHWFDHVGSLWGRRLLCAFYRGLIARQNEDIERFPEIVEARRQIHRCTSTDYYFTHGPKAGAERPWSWSLSMGSRFDSTGHLDHKDPIAFIRFGKEGNSGNDENLVARMPITSASLAEVRARFSEYLWYIKENEELGQGGTLGDPGKWMEEYTNNLYNEGLLLYSSALHLLANHCKIQHAFEILPYSAALSGLALNFPPSLVPRIKIPPEWEAWRQNEFGYDRLQALIDNCEPGFIYTTLCFWAKPPDSQGIEQWIDSVLGSALDLDLNTMQEKWLEAFDQETSIMLSEVSHNIFSMLMKAGEQWGKRAGVLGNTGGIIYAVCGSYDLPLPDAATLADEPLCWNSEKSFSYDDGHDTFSRINYLSEIRKRMDQFFDVCGI